MGTPQRARIEQAKRGIAEHAFAQFWIGRGECLRLRQSPRHESSLLGSMIVGSKSPAHTTAEIRDEMRGAIAHPHQPLEPRHHGGVDLHVAISQSNLRIEIETPMGEDGCLFTETCPREYQGCKGGIGTN